MKAGIFCNTAAMPEKLTPNVKYNLKCSVLVWKVDGLSQAYTHIGLDLSTQQLSNYI